MDYYWTSEQTEWATDVLFRDATVLGNLFPTLVRRGIVSFQASDVLRQASNARYLEALSTIVSETPLSRLTDKLCRPVQIGKRRFRGLRPFDPEEAKLWEIVSRGETLITGFRNRDVRQALYGAAADEDERRRQAARVTRKFATLRAHGLIKKIPHTHRYILTIEGVTAITALLAARRASLTRLTAA